MSNALVSIKQRPVRDKVSSEEWQVRVDLAACYRLLSYYGITDLIYNHVTARVPGSDHFLINSYGMLYEEVTASSLQKIDTDARVILKPDNDFDVNPAGYVIHSAIHAGRENAGCVIHTHTRAAVAVAATQAGLLPLSQSAMMFYGEVAYHDFEGPAINVDERARLVADLGFFDVMILRNHGTLTVGRSVPHAFLLAYQFENACRIQVDAMAAGLGLNIPPAAVCVSVPPIMRDPRSFSASSLEWRAMLRMLDRRDPSYAD